MMTFDASSRDLCSVKRQQTNTPLQALVLLNDPQLIEASRLMAFNELKKTRTVEEQIVNIFQKATSRLPDETEMQMLKDFHQQTLSKIEAQEILPKTYLSIGSHELDEGTDMKALTALSMTAHTILNLDETITRG